METLSLNELVKLKRKSLGLTQEELSNKAGVGLRFVRELERGKPTLKMDKVNQVLKLFGYELGPVELNRKNYGKKLMNTQDSFLSKLYK